MMKLPGFVDMKISPKDAEKDSPALSSMGDRPLYPYGLSLCLCDDELEKLNLNKDCEVGDKLLLDCIVEVTSVSRNATTDGERTRVEMQITAIAVDSEEEERAEVPAMTPKRKIKASSFYK